MLKYHPIAEYQVHLQKNIMKQGWEWRLVAPPQPGQMLAVAISVHMTTLEEGEFAPAFMTLPEDAMQQIMNQMWNAGFRPSVEGSEGELTATKKHLEDMRTIVFDMMKLTK